MIFAAALNWASVLVTIPVVIMCLVFVVQIGLHVSRSSFQHATFLNSIAGTANKRIAVLVPAHNEAEVIAVTLGSIIPQLREGDRLLVVADNCDDDTAQICRSLGAEVVERHDLSLRGKGFALDFGIQHLRADPPDMVVIIDADCLISQDALKVLANCVDRDGRPAQARYLMINGEGAGIARRTAEFAWRVRNWVRPDGWARWGMPCQLMGSGMAFEWPVLRDAQLGNASIVEDMKLGIELAMVGLAPVFCPGATVTSRFPDAKAASMTQRTRWEHGHLQMIFQQIPRMVYCALRRGDIRLFGLALDLAVPPLALLAGAMIAAWLLGLAVWLLGEAPWTLLCMSTMLATFVWAVLMAWVSRGRDLLTWVDLLSIPWYVVAKLPIYAGFIIRRQKEWVRTDRKG